MTDKLLRRKKNWLLRVAAGFIFALVTLGITGHAQSQLLKVGILNEPKTLNPFVASTAWSRTILRHLLMPLYIHEPKNLDLIPWLAEGDPSYSADRKSVIVKLKKAKWSDGSDFTADDIVYTANVIQEFKIPRHLSRWEMVEKIEAVDPQTLKYTLREPDASFESSTLLSIIVQKKYWDPIVDKARKSQSPVTQLTSYQPENQPTLGPFYLKSWSQGNSILLLANDLFFAKGTKIDGLDIGPFINGILFKFYGNADASILALKKGDVDSLASGISPGYVEDLKQASTLEIFTDPKSGFNYLGFNCRKPPFNLKEFRQAVACIVDKDFLVERVLQGSGTRRDSIIPQGNKFWYNPDLPTPCLSEKGDDRLKKAYELLKSKGWSWKTPPIGDSGNMQTAQGLTMPDGTPVAPFDLLTPPADYDPSRAITAMLISEWMQRLGIPVSCRPMAFNAMLQKIKGEQNFDIFIMGYDVLQPDPDVLQNLFYSKYDQKNGSNLVGFHNNEFDELCQQSSITFDKEKRKQMVFKLQEILAEECPVVPLFTAFEIEAVRKKDFTGWVAMQDGIDNLWSYLVLKPTGN